MAKLILKSPYLKCGGSGTVSGYMRYIATRENVQIVADARPATKRQEQLIAKLLRDFPDTKELFEYEDWSAAPTKAHASAFITAALELNWDAASRSDVYMKYIATRPRAERLGSHGLFGDSDTVDLDKAMAELDVYTGNVWTHIISLRREDAARLGYDSAGAWRNLLRAHRNEIAAAMHILPENFRWHAAFHDEGEHPHVHMMAWSSDPKQGYLNQDGIRAMRSKLTNDIFKQEMLHLYEQKSASATSWREAQQACGAGRADAAGYLRPPGGGTAYFRTGAEAGNSRRQKQYGIAETHEGSGGQHRRSNGTSAGGGRLLRKVADAPGQVWLLHRRSRSG